MNHDEINTLIVKLEARLFSNSPEINTREDIAKYEAWTNERKVISKAYKAALVEGNADKAARILVVAEQLIAEAAAANEEDEDDGLDFLR